MKKNFFKGHIFLLGFFLSSGCVYGPPREVKSPLYYLNGDLYERDSVTVNGMALFIKRKPKKTLISGSISLQSSPTNSTFPRLKLLLTQKDKIIASSMVQENGRFFMEDYILNGSYQLKIDDSRFQGELDLVVSTYEIKDVLLVVKDTKQGTKLGTEEKGSLRPLPMD